MAATQTSAFYVLPPSTVRDFFHDPTLMLSRLVWQIRQGATQATTAGFWGIGLIAWSDVNDTVPTDPPGPVTDGYLDWIFNHITPVPIGTAALLYGPPDNASIISKAKRRLGDDKGILLCLETVGMTGGAAVAAYWRGLIKA